MNALVKRLIENAINVIQTKFLPIGKKVLSFIKKQHNRISDKKLSSKVEYVTLTPDDKIANGTEYIKALKWAIKGKKAKNIALSGPYGSGKSSVIETFLKKHCFYKRKSIKISMATFVEEVLNDNNTYDKKKIKLKEEDIEKGILEQLFYKVNHKRIPQSRYRKLRRINFSVSFISTLLLVLAFVVLIYVFWPSALEYVVKKIIVAGASAKLPKRTSIALAVLFLLICVAVVSKIYQTFFSRYRIKEVKLPKDISIERDAEKPDTIFNRNMDEIVYFFQETKYHIVFFEDLDRLNTPSVFIHLRMLNTILNNCDDIKKPIVFIYAVKDDIFTDEDRTKFFDFIIPIVPIVNSTNSGEILLQKLEGSKKLKKEHNISENFIMDVSPFISDMRILQNIYNEFLVYKSTLKTGQNLKLLDEPMFALIIFKNLYPREFAELQKECGIVKQAFYDKESFISVKRQEIQKRIDSSTEVLENIRTEFFSTRISLKCAFLCEITNYVGVAYNFTPKGESYIRATDFMQEDYEIPDWSKTESCSVSYTSWAGGGQYSLNKTDFSEIYEKFIQSYKSVNIIEGNKMEEEKASIETMRRQINELSSKSLSELIAAYGKHAVLSTDVTANDLLVFLLRRGYVDEDYVDYINYFKATSITTEDMNYILSVKNLSPRSYDYKLTRTDLVVERLQPYEFEQEAVYNFDLLECLLSSSKYDKKLDLYVKQLSNGSEASVKFIDEFIDVTQHRECFIKILSKHWNKMWDSVFDSSVFTLDRKFYYLSLLVSYASIESIQSMDSNGKLTTFFISNADVLRFLSCVDEQKTINVIASLKIKFVDIQTENVSARILDYIFDNSFYEINFEMIKHIVEYKNKDLVPQLKEKNFSTLLLLDYTPVLKYIEDNIDVYTDEIVLLPSNTEEDLDAIVKLLELNIGSKSRHFQIIGNENFYVEDITMICLSLIDTQKDYVRIIWNSIMENEKLKPTWKNLNSYWYYFGHTDASIAYMCKNADVLTKDDSTCIEDESFIKEFIEFDIDQTSFAKLLPKLSWKDFNIQLNTLDENKVSILISQKYFEFNVDRYNELLETFPTLAVEFIIQNQSDYMSAKDEIDMDSKLLEALVFDERFTRSNAEVLIDAYGEKFMTSQIAKNLRLLKITVNCKIFDLAWKFLNSEEKESLMLENVKLLDANKFELYFSDLNTPYKEFTKRKYRHEVDLKDTKENLNLANQLQKIGYITSFRYKTREKYDPVQKEVVTYKVLSCFVKAIY